MFKLKIDSFKILCLIAEKEMSKTEFAESIDYTRSNFNVILKRGTCKTHVAGKIAHALGVPVSEITINE
jgi:DNA-binding Xre family transcriptional regulator